MSSGKRNSSPESSVVVSEVEILFGRRVETSPLLVLSRHSHVWCPPTDLYETEDHYVVQVEIAGMRHADFNVIINGRRLSISGLRHGSGERRAYYQMEIHYGEFRTDLELPAPVQTQGIDATYRDGFIRVVLPKSKDQQAAE